jgi:hypothetical protein
VIAVEAKADESFGPTVGEALKAAHVRLDENPRSKGLVRIEELTASLFGRDITDPVVSSLRYQLLTACAGALSEAARLSWARALMLVHEFVTDSTADKKHRRNSADLNQFVSVLSRSSIETVATGEIAGPIEVPGAPLFAGGTGLFIGKVTRRMRTGDGQ